MGQKSSAKCTRQIFLKPLYLGHLISHALSENKIEKQQHISSSPCNSCVHCSENHKLTKPPKSGNEIMIECDRKQHRMVSNNFFVVLTFFSILSPAKRPFQADGSKWLKRLLLVANRDRPCTFVHFLTPPPPISLPSLSL